ncbi:phytoene desaturase [Actinopolymorpha cephalotaxi]|uniref:Phytoene desaturase n=1 Tax=Actinopolymorpha cephalotaxi TaxID=504797 RepID=A0A1I2YDH9_9ACTN|nr:phytoene desaturase family protein [Actinopolymorpha cephalotaxi]NYH87049.1 phytoene desaturase [Actinopolymorpha cephalotaxi]SFH23076.1 phytoene desaturase [Actinopolymorpha cephalotaxi]
MSATGPGTGTGPSSGTGLSGTRPRRRVVIVGAGLGGLSAACHLAGAGHQVTVVEQGSRPGGRAGRIESGGFTFDTGPTVLTMPDLLEATFAAAGTSMADLLTLRPLDPSYRANFADGSTIALRHGREAMAAEIREKCGPAEEAGFVRMCNWLESLYQLEMPAFIDRNYDHFWDLARPLGPALGLFRLGALRRLESAIRRYFTDERLVRLFSFQAMYAGLAPQQALAVFAVITYMDSVRGVYFPEGGIGAVPAAMATAAQKAGATFVHGARVVRVLHEGDVPGSAGGGRAAQVRGVLLADGTEIPADAVVVNADLPTAYRTLLPELTAPVAARKGRYSPSAFVWHVGVRGLPPPEATHHNIHFGKEWSSSFRTLLREGKRMPDPSVLVTVPTLTDPGLAPDGSSVLYVLEPVPNLSGKVDWTVERGATRDRLAGLVEGWGYPSDVVVEETVDPTDWAYQGMARGTPFALAHTFFQSGPFRPPNVDRRMRGLVFVGSGTVPGVGVPMVLVSGRLAAERVEEL